MKYKNLLAGILLFDVFAILKLFFGGPKFDNFFRTELMPLLIIFGVISLVMMIIPGIYKLIKRNNVEHKKGIMLCLINSFILTILAVIPNVIIVLNKDQDTGMSYDPIAFSKGLIIMFLILGIIYYFINYLLFVEKRIDK